jgi:phage protein D
MTAPVHSYTEVLGPRVYLEANSAMAADLMPMLSKFEFTDDEKKANVVHMTFSDPYHTLVDDPRFASGASYRCCWGYPSDLSPMVGVTLARVKPSFKGGVCPMEAVAFDVRLEMTKTSNARNWGAVSSSYVAHGVASSYGFLTDIEESSDSRKQSRVQPAGTTDWSYLMSLAEKLNWDCYVDEQVLHFHHKRYEDSPLLTFIYYTDPSSTMLDFSPEVDLNKAASTGSAGADPKRSKGAASNGAAAANGASPGMYQISTEQPKGKLLVPGTSVKSAGGGPITSASPESSAKVTGIHAGAESQKLDMKAVKASIKVIGTPRLRAKMMIRILGVGKSYSGNWRVVSTKHTIVSGGAFPYITEAKLERGALNKGKVDDKTKKPNDKGGANDGAGGGGKVMNQVNTGSQKANRKVVK